MVISKYLIVKSSETLLPAAEVITAINREAMPVLWLNDGLFCLIPKEVVQNTIDLYEPFLQAQDPEYKLPELVLSWNQGIEVSNDIARILMGE